MILLFTDFGISGPYLAEMSARILRINSRAQVLNLISNVMHFEITAAAYLLNAYSQQFPRKTVFLCVIDPGVGGERLPVVLECDGRWYVGPMNGLFDVLISNSSEFSLFEIPVDNGIISRSFHGRDVFAPMAAKLDNGASPVDLGLVEVVEAVDKAPCSLREIIYLDDYGNGFTGIQAADINKEDIVQVADHELRYAHSFCYVSEGEGMWYLNSVNLVEIAVNQGSAKDKYGLTVGKKVEVLRP